MDVANHHSVQELQRIGELETRVDLAKRLRTGLLAKQGFTAPEIATWTEFSWRMVQKWVERYNHKGVVGLATRAG
jgi:transposase